MTNVGIVKKLILKLFNYSVWNVVKNFNYA